MRRTSKRTEGRTSWDFRFCNAAKAYVKEINSNQVLEKLESKSTSIGCVLNLEWLQSKMMFDANASIYWYGMTDEFVGNKRPSNPYPVFSYVQILA